MALARHKYETGQISQRIYQRHDLCGQISARPSDRLTMSPPLAPVPYWWTWTIMPSIMAYSSHGRRITAQIEGRRLFSPPICGSDGNWSFSCRSDPASLATALLWPRSIRLLRQSSDCLQRNGLGHRFHREAQGEPVPTRHLSRVDPRSTLPSPV